MNHCFGVPVDSLHCTFWLRSEGFDHFPSAEVCYLAAALRGAWSYCEFRRWRRSWYHQPGLTWKPVVPCWRLKIMTVRLLFCGRSTLQFCLCSSVCLQVTECQLIFLANWSLSFWDCFLAVHFQTRSHGCFSTWRRRSVCSHFLQVVRRCSTFDLYQALHYLECTLTFSFRFG